MDTDDLLRPTLTEEDDVVGVFDRPWAPWSLVFASFFCGPIGGGALFTWNALRLGLRREVAPTVACFAALAVAWAFGAAATKAFDVDVAPRVVRLANHAATVLLAIAFARRQQRRHHLFEMSTDGDSAHLFGWGVLAFLVGRLGEGLLVVMALFALGVDVEELGS